MFTCWRQDEFARACRRRVPQPRPVELAEADAKADAETFVIGDWYKLRVKRRGVSTQLKGTLVKVNDQWIVLRIISEGRREFAVPVVSKVPFVGKRLFKNVGIGSDRREYLDPARCRHGGGADDCRSARRRTRIR